MDSEVETKVNKILDHQTIQESPGGDYSFRIIGPCCKLYDREELPWPCSRIAWKTKEPSWRRIGKRLIPDIAARRCPSYSVEILQPGLRRTNTVLTFYSGKLSSTLQEWWYSRHPRSKLDSNIAPLID